jgi:hypothetical protein
MSRNQKLNMEIKLIFCYIIDRSLTVDDYSSSTATPDR